MKDDLDIKSWLRTFGIAVLHIGRKYYNFRDLVVYDAPSQFKIPLRTNQFTIEDIDPTKPTCREREVYGTIVATKKALDRFLKNALHGESPTKDRGAALCYCQIVRNNGLVSRIEILRFYSPFKVTFSTSFIRSVIRRQSLDGFFCAQRSLCTKRSHYLLEYVGRLRVSCRS